MQYLKYHSAKLEAREQVAGVYPRMQWERGWILMLLLKEMIVLNTAIGSISVSVTVAATVATPNYILVMSPK